MNAVTVAELLSDLLGAPAMVKPAPTAANPAKAANVQRPQGLPADSAPCESLRISAKSEQDSQVFAALRNPGNGLSSERRRGSSQDSQDSQGGPANCTSASAPDLASVAWTDADIARFLDRRARLIRWGWPEPEAEKLAECLVRRDRSADDRSACVECQHYRPGRCGNHCNTSLHSGEVGRDLASMLQRCPSFDAIGPRP